MQKNIKTFVTLRNHNIKKRFNIWQEDIKTGTITCSHISNNATTLEDVIAKAKEYQEFSDRVEKGKFIYHVDIEILVENSQGENLMEDGDVAYAITVYPQVNDFCKTGEW